VKFIHSVLIELHCFIRGRFGDGWFVLIHQFFVALGTTVVRVVVHSALDAVCGVARITHEFAALCTCLYVVVVVWNRRFAYLTHGLAALNNQLDGLGGVALGAYRKEVDSIRALHSFGFLVARPAPQFSHDCVFLKYLLPCVPQFVTLLTTVVSVDIECSVKGTDLAHELAAFRAWHVLIVVVCDRLEANLAECLAALNQLFDRSIWIALVADGEYVFLVRAAG
jgi:hypothetical protein